DLVQGGKGLILRAPVYWPDPDFATEGDVDGSKRQLWGIVSLVLDYDQFLINSGIREAEERYDILIHAASPQVGGGPQMFTYGDRGLLEADTVTLEFDFSFEEWMLEARTKGGWPKHAPDQWSKRALIASAGLMLLGTLLYVLQVSERRKRAEVLLSSGIEALNDGFVM
ncbi:MAG TPA: ATPase, partial [Sulfitobacter sp.]|nr:ATPase [Sulfitobacter sp.]